MITYECPFSELQKGVYKLLSDSITDYEIWDDATPIEELESKYGGLDDAKFGLLREVTGVPSVTKVDTLIWDVNMQIYLISNYRGKKVVNEMVNDVCTVLTACVVPMDNFKPLMAKIASVSMTAEKSSGNFTWHIAAVDVNFRIESNKY